MKSIASIIAAFLLAFALCVYIPQKTYFTNINEFSFDHISLAVSLSVPFMIVFLVAFVLLHICSILFSTNAVTLFKRTYLVGLFHILLLAIVFCIWSEGAYLSLGIPKISGEPGLYASSLRMLTDSLFWIAALCGALRFWRWLTKKYMVLALGLFIVMIAGIGDAVIFAEPKIPMSIDRQGVLNKLEFHQKENVIVLVPDGLPSFAAERILQGNRDLEMEFEGFTLFSNNLGPGGNTSMALPAILQGAPYDGGDYLDFAKNAFLGEESLPRLFSKGGYSVYVSTTVPRFCGLWSRSRSLTSDISISPAQLSSLLYHQLSFQFFPYIFKHYFEPDFSTQMVEEKQEASAETKNADHPTINFIINKLGIGSEKPTAVFLHYSGAHVPYDRDKNGNKLPKEKWRTLDALLGKGEWTLKDITQFLRALRHHGLYDDATIVVMADHGDNLSVMKYGTLTSYSFPLFMIKPKKQIGAIAYSSAPLSSTNLPNALMELHMKSTKIDDYIATLRDKRIHYLQDAGKLVEVDGINPNKYGITEIPFPKTIEATVLLPGVAYTFTRGSASNALATPLAAENLDPAGARGLYFSSNNGKVAKLVLRVNSSQTELDAKIDINTRQIDKAPETRFTVKDVSTGSILYENPREKIGEISEVDLYGITVTEEKTVALSFECQGRHHISLTGIIFDRK